ncbi:hypothetical protein ACER0C_017930 [Sarotherodon galilaeus]
MCQTEKQLIVRVALVLFTGLMVALWSSIWGDLQLNTMPSPRDVRTIGGTANEQRDKCLTKYGGHLELHYVYSTTQAFSFDLCNVINCKGKGDSWRGSDVYLCRLPRRWPEPGDRSWCGSWDDVWSHSQPSYWGPNEVRNLKETAALFSLKRGRVGTGTRSNPLLLTINSLKQNPWSIAYSGRCYDPSEDSFYMIIGVDQAGTDSMGIIKVVLHSKAGTVGWWLHSGQRTTAPQRLGVNVTDLAYETSRDPFVRYVNISSPEDVIQVETGYNTWLDWITYTASTNNMRECVACSTARPTLFTVAAPLLLREDRPGFDCMLQLHMKEGVGHDQCWSSYLKKVIRCHFSSVFPKGRKLHLFNQGKCHPDRKPRRCMVR